MVDCSLPRTCQDMSQKPEPHLPQCASRRGEAVGYLKVLEDECWDLRCVDEPIADTGDSDVVWHVVGHWMSQLQERVIGYGEQPTCCNKGCAAPA